MAEDFADYEQTRQRHIERYEELIGDVRARIDWPDAELRRERTHRLRALLTTAVERSPWHRERLQGIDTHEVVDSDVESLPVMTKSDLMDNFDDVVTDRRLTRERCEQHLAGLADDAYLLGEYHVVASGGSSGQRGVFVYGWDAWALLWASIARFRQRAGTATRPWRVFHRRLRWLPRRRQLTSRRRPARRSRRPAIRNACSRLTSRSHTSWTV